MKRKKLSRFIIIIIIIIIDLNKSSCVLKLNIFSATWRE